MYKYESLILQKLIELGNEQRGFLKIEADSNSNCMFYIISIGKHKYSISGFTEETLFMALVSINAMIASEEKWYG